MAENSRGRRLSELLQRELSQLLQRQIRNPDLGLVTVTKVMATSDLYSAKVYVTFLNEQISTKHCIEALNKLVPYLRGLLAANVNLRVTPQLKFHFDETLARGNHLLGLINESTAKN